MNITTGISSRFGKKFLFLFYGLVLIAAGTVVVMFILPINGTDGWIHLNWIEQFSSLFRDGIIYPRWMPASFSGYGSAAFYFYPPLPYWTGAILSLVMPFASLNALYFSITFLGSLLSVFTFRAYLKELGIANEASLIGALLYGFGAYRILDIFSRNAMSEQFAMIFLPLIFLAIEVSLRKSNKQSLKVYILFVIGFCGAVVSNIPLATLAALSAITYYLSRVRKETLSSILPLCIGVIGSLILLGIYLLPLILLRPQAHFEHLFQFGPGFGAGKVSASFFLTLVFMDLRITTVAMILSGALCLFFLFRYTKISSTPSRKQLAITYSCLLALGLITQIPYFGYYLHSKVFPFTLLQFYFRWNILLSFVVAATVAFFLSENIYKRFSFFIVSALTIAIVAVTVLQFLNPANPHSIEKHYDVEEYLPYSVDKYGNLLHTWLDADSSKNFATPMDGISVGKIDPYHYRITASLDSARRFTLHQFYWKQWKLTNQTGIEIPSIPDSFGRITFTLPQGHHIYSYDLTTSQAEIYGGILSIFGALSLLSVIVLNVRLTRQHRK